MAKGNDTKIPITEFLEAYKAQPILYNSQLDTYKNRVSREEAYEGIIKSLKIPHLTVTDIKLKIKSIRTVYTKELRLILQEGEMGRVYEPKLFWFRLADSFLRTVSLSHCKRLKGKQDDNGIVSKKRMLSPSEMSTKMVYDHAIENVLEEDSELEPIDDSYTGIIDDQQTAHGSANGKTINCNENNCVIAIGNENERNVAVPNVSTNNTANVSSALSRALSKSELLIDDSRVCVIESQQHQEEQPTSTQRKLRCGSHNQYIALPRLAPAPFAATAASPSHVPTEQFALPPNANAGFAFTGAEDEDILGFAYGVACQLRKMGDAYKRSMAKLRIQQAIFDAETGDISNSEPVTSHLHNF